MALSKRFLKELEAETKRLKETLLYMQREYRKLQAIKALLEAYNINTDKQ